MSVLLVLLLTTAVPQEPRGPHVVLIVADDVGRPKTLKTPRLEALAEEGMRWTQFYAGAPDREISRRALLTGRHGGRASMRGPGAPGTPTLPSLLEAAGYDVGVFEGAGADASERFLRDTRGKPFLLFWSASLDAGSEALDVAVGRLLDVLKERGAERDTLVVFTSHAGSRSDVAEGTLRVPMIARWTGTIQAGSSSDEHAWAGDLLPTCVELAGAAVPADIDGDSLAETLKGRPRKDRWRRAHELYWESAAAQATRFGKWKAIRSPIGTGSLELYDMSNDPGQKRDYAARRPDLARHAAALLDKRREPEAPK
jgi:arylsulfatase A-like enzyme